MFVYQRVIYPETRAKHAGFAASSSMLGRNIDEVEESASLLCLAKERANHVVN